MDFYKSSHDIWSIFVIMLHSILVYKLKIFPKFVVPYILYIRVKHIELYFRFDFDYVIRYMNIWLNKHSLIIYRYMNMFCIDSCLFRIFEIWDYRIVYCLYHEKFMNYMLSYGWILIGIMWFDFRDPLWVTYDSHRQGKWWAPLIGKYVRFGDRSWVVETSFTLYIRRPLEDCIFRDPLWVVYLETPRGLQRPFMGFISKTLYGFYTEDPLRVAICKCFKKSKYRFRRPIWVAICMCFVNKVHIF